MTKDYYQKMKTKEQIWQEQENNPDLSFSESALIAMEEYGTQQVLAFSEWKDKNFKHSIGGFVHVMGDLLYKGVFDNAGLYKLFIEIKSQNT